MDKWLQERIDAIHRSQRITAEDLAVTITSVPPGAAVAKPAPPLPLGASAPGRSAAKLLAHQLLLCYAALDQMAETPGIYPPDVVRERARQARLCLEATVEGRDLLAAEAALEERDEL